MSILCLLPLRGLHFLSVKVHSADNTRMELIIPGEQHFYMKAVNAAERQRWLVALGSSKACLTDTRTKKEKEISETSESLKTKMSELRLYCDLLMQQVHTIQEFVHHDENPSSPSIENMNEASSLLSATCNTFITTLEECVKIANAKFKPEMFQLSHPDPLVSPVSPSPVQMVGNCFSSSDVACLFLFLFLFLREETGSGREIVNRLNFFFFRLYSSLVLEAFSSLGSACAKVLIASPWRAVPFTPVCWENIIMLCGCCNTEEVGGTALLGIKLGIRLSKGIKLRKSYRSFKGFEATQYRGNSIL
uniref:Sesquipedalian n=1 Tax=Ursus maritimus TaxID=29073 RepID=A0A452UNT6_URSMA